MSDHIALPGGLTAERTDDEPSGCTYAIELANPTTGRITVLRVQLPHPDDAESGIHLSAAWRGWEPRTLDALAPRWLEEAVAHLVPEVEAAERARHSPGAGRLRRPIPTCFTP